MKGHVTHLTVFGGLVVFSIVIAVGWIFYLLKLDNPDLILKGAFFKLLGVLLLLAVVFFGALVAVSYLVKRKH